nr:putative uncharacterized protein [uncultured bacterium]
MSVPLPIHVALVSSSKKQIASIRRHFRLSAPGIGPAYISALDALPGDTIVTPSQLPKGRIALWITLDSESYKTCMKLHKRDLRMPDYGRGFYSHHFPEACVLIEKSNSPTQLKKTLASWSSRIIDAWYESS